VSIVLTQVHIDASDDDKQNDDKQGDDKKDDDKKDDDKKEDAAKKEDATKKEDTVVTQTPEKVGDVIADLDLKCEFKVTVSDSVNGEVEFSKVSDVKMTKVTIPATVVKNGITYKVTSVAPNTFANNKSITSVTVGENVNKIGTNAFSGCTKLKKINLGSTLTEIGDRAFYKNMSLTKITIPSTVSKIGKQAFAGCKKLKTITIKTKLLTSKKVGTKAFKGIHKKAVIKVPKSKYKTYKKMLKKKGIGKKVIIKN
jgi:hypothetical protein